MSLYLLTSVYKLFCGNTQKKVLYQRNNFTCSGSKETVFVLFRPCTIFMTLLLKTFIGSCSPPKLLRIFHRTNSQVENSVCFSLHFVVSALNFQGYFEILFCLSWSLDVQISKERKLVLSPSETLWACAVC